jgi:hypothetical protein
MMNLTSHGTEIGFTLSIYHGWSFVTNVFLIKFFSEESNRGCLNTPITTVFSLITLKVLQKNQFSAFRPE